MNTEPASKTEILSASACWAKLRSSAVGRLATCATGKPDILPINFVVDHDTIVFRTAGGLKLTAATAGADVALEADGYEPETGRAWSVVVKGSAHLITRSYDLIETAELPLIPWHPEAKGHFVRILVTQVSGRAFRVVDRARWDTPVSGTPHAAVE